MAEKAGRIVVKPPELEATLCRQWDAQWAGFIGLTASAQVPGWWGTKNPSALTNMKCWSNPA